MFIWDINHIINATKGKKVGNHNYDMISSSNISIDTRKIKNGDIFIAIKGKIFDGHTFLYEALLKGAVLGIISDKRYVINLPIIIVDDTVEALHNMASYYIKNILVNTKVIAITGSVGKTSTKDMLHNVLSKYGISHANEGNLNNNIGLPLTVLKTPKNCQYLILEMGMSRSSEIKKLSIITNPDISVITNIEPAHIENFPSLLSIAQAKLEILYGMKDNSTLILNKDNRYYDYLSLHANKNLITFGKNKSSTICLLEAKQNNYITYLKIKINMKNDLIINCNLPVIGVHFIYSILAVIAVMKDLGLDISRLPFITKNFKLRKGRGGKVHKAKFNEKDIFLIDDSYNANPTSMKASVKTFGNINFYRQRKIALLGDMLELGNKSQKFHREILEYITKYDINKVYTVGDSMLELHKILPDNMKGIHFHSSYHLKSSLDCFIKNNDLILVKASRGIRMDIAIKEFIIES